MNDTNHPSGAPWRNFYGRFKGKTLRPRQHVYLAEDLDALSPGPISWEANPDRTLLDPKTILQGRPLWLEIGFGGGEHLVHMAEANPGIGLIGCEPFENAVAMTLGKIRDTGVANVAIHPGDVRDLFDVLPDGVIERAFLLYPDPWPKNRHHRRRFVTPEHLDPLARVMAPGAVLRVATDIPDYVRQTLQEVPRAGFEGLCTAAPDWHRPWADWTRTRYEQKALREGRVPHYLTFRRKDAEPDKGGKT
jgi:tRNA (guanine-N7-)-methyltransferase